MSRSTDHQVRRRRDPSTDYSGRWPRRRRDPTIFPRGPGDGLPERPWPRSPVQSARKFSAVLGTTSARSVISMRPAGEPPIVMSKKTCGSRRWLRAARGASGCDAASSPWVRGAAGACGVLAKFPRRSIDPRFASVDRRCTARRRRGRAGGGGGRADGSDVFAFREQRRRFWRNRASAGAIRRLGRSSRSPRAPRSRAAALERARRSFVGDAVLSGRLTPHASAIWAD